MVPKPSWSGRLARAEELVGRAARQRAGPGMWYLGPPISFVVCSEVLTGTPAEGAVRLFLQWSASQIFVHIKPLQINLRSAGTRDHQNSVAARSEVLTGTPAGGA